MAPAQHRQGCGHEGPPWAAASEEDWRLNKKKKERRVSQLPSGQAGPWETWRRQGEAPRPPPRLPCHFYQVGGPPPILLSRLDISGGAGSQWCPPLVFFLEPKGLGTGGSPHQGVRSIGLNMGGISRRGGARGEGGAEDQWWWEERSWQEAALRRSPLLKTLSGRGWDSSYCKKVKVEVSLFTFNFCCVNCCNTSQLLLLTGSRLLKLLLTTKCISTRISVCLFYSTFSCCKIQFKHYQTTWYLWITSDL